MSLGPLSSSAIDSSSPNRGTNVNFDPLQRSRSLSAERKTENVFSALPPRTKLSVEDVTADVEGLKRLMNQGSWRNVIKLSEKCISNGVKYPHDLLQLKLVKIISLMKLRQYKAVSDEIEALGAFEDKQNLFQSFPQLYPNLQGSFVPFSIRVIKAQLPEFMKTGTSLDELYQLLALCKSQIEILNENGENFRRKESSSVVKLVDHLTPLLASPSPFPSVSSASSSVLLDECFFGNFEETLANWKDREICVTLLIATRLVQEKEYPLAILLLQQVLKKYQNANLLSAIGRVYLQMGNIKAATATFKQVEQMESEVDPNLVSMNKGFLSLAVNQFTTAIDHFQQVLQRNPKDITAANNKAVCLLYTCNLSHAVASLEDFIFKDPESNLHETLVFNLCTLYDLKSENSLEKKKNILALVGKYASDDFDFSVVKLNGT